MNIKSIGRYIENLDMRVEDQDREKFNDILGAYLSEVDPDNEYYIKDAVNLLGESKAIKLLNKLLDLRYEPEE